MKKTIVLGQEYDQHLRRRLLEALRSLGATSHSSEWLVGGSQEVASALVEVEGEHLTIEAETYVGLSISGEATIVDRIAAMVAHTT